LAHRLIKRYMGGNRPPTPNGGPYNRSGWGQGALCWFEANIAVRTSAHETGSQGMSSGCSCSRSVASAWMGGGRWSGMLQRVLHLSWCETAAGRPWRGEVYWRMLLGHLVKAQMSSGIVFSSSLLIHFPLSAVLGSPDQVRLRVLFFDCVGGRMPELVRRSGVHHGCCLCVWVYMYTNIIWRLVWRCAVPALRYRGSVWRVFLRVHSPPKSHARSSTSDLYIVFHCSETSSSGL